MLKQHRPEDRERPLRRFDGEHARRPARRSWLLRGVAVGAAAALAGCTAGPDFVRPAPPATPRYTADAVPARTAATPGPAGGTQAIVPGRAVPPGWWGWFGSGELDALVAQAFATSPTLEVARSRLRGAEATLRTRRALRLPEISGNADASYGASGGQGGGTGGFGNTSAFVVYTAGVSIAYDFDLAGRNRRLIESAAARMENQRQEVQAAYLALVGNIVATAFDAAALHAQIATREELVRGQQQRIALVRTQVQEGFTARSALVAAEAEVAALRATVPPLRQGLAVAEHALAELIGKPPAEAGVPLLRLDRLRLPQSVPIVLPAALARQRPDILAAEALLHVASAEVGVATADLYPNLTLSGALGLVGINSAVSRSYDLGTSLLAPLFDGGRRRAQRDVAVAAYQEALGTYRARLLAALVQVANGLRALDNDAVALVEQATALAAARESYDLALFQEREGAIGPIEVLVVQQRYQDARLAYIDAVARRFQDTAALFAALAPGPVDEAGLRSIVAGEHLGATRAALNGGGAPGALP